MMVSVVTHVLTLSVEAITVLCHFRKINLMPIISCLTSLTSWPLFHVIFNFSGTLVSSCVNRIYSSNVKGCPSCLNIFHYKVLPDAC